MNAYENLKNNLLAMGANPEITKNGLKINAPVLRSCDICTKNIDHVLKEEKKQ